MNPRDIGGHRCVGALIIGQRRSAGLHVWVRSARWTRSAFTLIELIVIILVIALLAGLVIPWLARAKQRSQMTRCSNNLKQVGLAFRIWGEAPEYSFQISTNEGGAMELIAPGATFLQFRALSTRVILRPFALTCPADTRGPTTNWLSLTESNVSYFVGLDAADTQPETLLSGDRNLTLNGVAVSSQLVDVTTNSVLGWTAQMHRGVGNIAPGDGSVQRATPARLTEQVRQQETATNRLLVP
jgi:type II secretory pathway pseudopilin PulG